MPRDKYRAKRSAISISGAMYKRLQDYAEQNGVTLGSVLADATSDIGHVADTNAILILIVPEPLKQRLEGLARANGCTVVKLIETALGRAKL